MSLRKDMDREYSYAFDNAAAGRLPDPFVHERWNRYLGMARDAGHQAGRTEFERQRRAYLRASEETP